VTLGPVARRHAAGRDHLRPAIEPALAGRVVAGPRGRGPGLLPGTIQRLYGHTMSELVPGTQPMGALPVQARTGGKVPARSGTAGHVRETRAA
jgi:hypothetical protein